MGNKGEIIAKFNTLISDSPLSSSSPSSTRVKLPHIIMFVDFCVLPRHTQQQQGHTQSTRSFRVELCSNYKVAEVGRVVGYKGLIYVSKYIVHQEETFYT